jgi:predicted nucleotidyltransferase component of viral defense system
LSIILHKNKTIIQFSVLDVATYKIEELLGTKLSALYQKRRGRDLFDFYRANQKIKNLDIEC